MKATDLLLTDHKLIRKVLSGLSLDNPRYSHILKTMSRTVIGHSWFEDEIFLPAFKLKGLLHKLFTDEIEQEHKDMKKMLSLLREMSPHQKKEIEALNIQYCTVLETHLKKEEDALFPLAERILDAEGLNKLGNEMENRKTEIRGMVKDFY